MAYRYKLNILPITLTDLTVTIEYDNQEFPTQTLTLNDFSIEDDELSDIVTILSDCTITVQSQGYTTETYNILAGETETDIHITLTPVQNYFSKVSDGTNIYWVKDIDARETLESKADSSDIPTAISDLTDDTSTYPIDKADTLTGLTASITELNYTGGVTSNIQTQLNGKVNSSDIWYDSNSSTLYIGVAQS